ncbi:MAG: hypothetical protein QOJ64_4187, partial [Acidobacteriota bacterium]|nr:hypothetical protein [Acidobacteriota bacterium]
MIKRRPTILLVVLALALLVAGWLYWNRPVRVDMAAYVPADSLAFVEANDLTGIGGGLERTDAWKALATPMGVKPTLLPNQWLIRLARWTGFGSAEATLISRSQIAVAFMGGRASEANTTLTIKPLAALIIETHTTQRRMRPVLEKLFEEFAQRAYGQASLVRKQVDGVDLAVWSSPDGARTIVTAFVDTVAIAGNDESTVLRCVDVRRGKVPSLSDGKQLAEMRRQVSTTDSSLFGFVAKAGVKPLLQAWALNRAGSVPEAAAASKIFADTFGNLIEGLAWS